MPEQEPQSIEDLRKEKSDVILGTLGVVTVINFLAVDQNIPFNVLTQDGYEVSAEDMIMTGICMLVTIVAAIAGYLETRRLNREIARQS